MITERDLLEAIAECEGTPKPNANTCVKLAAYYTILNNMRGEEPKQQMTADYSYDSAPTIPYSNSEFSQIAGEKGIEKVFPVLDELMQTIAVLNPRLYQSVIRKLEEV
jgi:hypothetical protein